MMCEIIGNEFTVSEWREKIEALHTALTEQEFPDEVKIDDPAKITQKQSVSLIWLLNEVFEIIPKTDDLQFELCVDCETTFWYSDEGGLCEKCGKFRCDGCGGRRCSECACCSDCCECETEDDE